MYPNYKILNIQVRPVPKENSTFPVVKQPSKVGDYSVTPEGIFENSNSQIRYVTELAPSALPFTLNDVEAAEKYEELFNFDVRDLDNMFLFLRSVEDKFVKCSPDSKFKHLDFDIVCTREVLQLIMCAPYESKQSWTIAATSYQNTIYLCQVSTPESNPTAQANPEKRLKANWTKKLREHCLLAIENNVVLPKDPKQSECGQYFSVFSMEICGIRLLFDAPVLAKHCTSPFLGVPVSFVELQLRSDTMNRAEWTNHNVNEVLKWWADCFLVGIESVYIAYYDTNSFVTKIQSSKVRELYKDCDNDWSANVCGNFLAGFLSTIKNLLADVSCANTIYLFEFDGKTDNIVYRVVSERCEQMIIPDWFKTMMSK